MKKLIRLYDQGRFEDALVTANALLEQTPGDASLHNKLGVLCARLGRFDEALTHYDRALHLKSGYAEAFNNRGTAFTRLGRYDDAIASFQNALAIMPNFAEAHNNLGNALHATGQLERAEASLSQSLKLQPDYAEAYDNLGNVLFARRRYEVAGQSFMQALRCRPDFADAYVGFGKALNALGFHRQAVDNIRKGLAQDPNVASWQVELGNALSDLGQVEDAVDSFRRAVEIEPALAEAHGNLGNALAAIGRVEEAVASYEHALRLQPGLCETHYVLGLVKGFSPDDVRLPELRNMVKSDALSDSDRCFLSFTLGKACEDIGEFDEAVAFYQRGNQLRKTALRYDIDLERERFARIKALFDASSGARSKATGNTTRASAPRPIFIVGMPRSGTSLVEQILASHSSVYGAGELRFAARIMAPVMRDYAARPDAPVNEALFSRIRDEYLGELAQIAGDSPVVTDKMPGNFLWTGFLLEAMPDAKIVHMRRDPVATCWSLYKRRFDHFDFSNDLEDLGAYYLMYEDLMRFWHEAFPGRIYDLGYEALTESQEAETRRLLEYCDLPWEDACLEFHATQRPVQTVSGNQVRRKMYTGSSEAWRPFAAHLEPLIEILKADR